MKYSMSAVVGACLLVACSGPENVTAVPVPVLVMQPVVDAMPGVTLPGEVRARHESVLSFQVDGRVRERRVDAGQSVVEGQVLAAVDASDLLLRARAARAECVAAQAELRQLKDDLIRYRTLAAKQLVSRSALDQQQAAFNAARAKVDAARANANVLDNQVDHAQLRAPDDGIIVRREAAAEVGQLVAAGQALFTFASNEGREVRINLPEAALRQFTIGTPVQVQLEQHGAASLPGTVVEIAAAADPRTRTFAAYVRLRDDALGHAALGLGARVQAMDEGRRGALQVPLTALQRGEDGTPHVWVVDPAQSLLKAVAVRTGASSGERIEIVAGLCMTDWVVVGDGAQLRAGQRVTAVDGQNRPVLPTQGHGHATGGGR